VRKIALFGLVVTILGFAASPALAQKVELHPYAGGIFPTKWNDSFLMKDQGIYGLKAGVFLADRLQLEGNVGYVNHFEFEGADVRSRAFIWEAGPSFNFFSSTFSKAVPFLSVKAGATTAFVGDVEDVSDASASFANIMPAGSPPLIVEDWDAFFQFSYGGGVKGLGLWGPLGLRGEVRGRTMPNFFGRSITWLETTGGLTFSWGER
jgi:hypothetical protein